ncbi:MAG: hypothetical protein WC878_02840 [Candidatus Paceibacterota bacterium]|jgi:hypothetical protein
MKKILFLASLFLFPLTSFASPVYTVSGCETAAANGDYSLNGKWNNGDHEVSVYENTSGTKLYFSGVNRWYLSSVLSSGDDNYYYGNTVRSETSPVAPPEIYLPQLGTGSSCVVTEYGVAPSLFSTTPSVSSPVPSAPANPSIKKASNQAGAAAFAGIPAFLPFAGAAAVLLALGWFGGVRWSARKQQS